MTALYVTVKTCVEVLDLSAEDFAARQLALEYALAIDQANGDRRVLRSLGPELLRVLTELQMTPKSRQTIKHELKEVASDDVVTFSNRRASARSKYPE